MIYISTDEDTGVTHITNGDMTLCGLLHGWTRPDDKPSKQKWGCTCAECQETLEELREIRK